MFLDDGECEATSVEGRSLADFSKGTEVRLIIGIQGKIMTLDSDGIVWEPFTGKKISVPESTLATVVNLGCVNTPALSGHSLVKGLETRVAPGRTFDVPALQIGEQTILPLTDGVFWSAF